MTVWSPGAYLTPSESIGVCRIKKVAGKGPVGQDWQMLGGENNKG